MADQMKEGEMSQGIADKISDAMSCYLNTEGAAALPSPPLAMKSVAGRKPKPTFPPNPSATTTSIKASGKCSASARLTATNPGSVKEPATHVPPCYLRKSEQSHATSKEPKRQNENETGTGTGTGTAEAKSRLSEIAGSRLYARAKQQQRDLKKRQKENPANCTFAPQFQTSGKSRGTTARRAGEFSAGMTETASGQERFDCLYRNAQSVREKKQNTIRRNEQQPPGCSFTPTLHVKNRSLHDQTTGLKRMHTLYSDGKKIKKKMEILKAERSNSNETFSPQITRKAKDFHKFRSSADKDFSSRLHRDDRIKYGHLATKKEELELSGCTFRPKISRRCVHYSFSKVLLLFCVVSHGDPIALRFPI